MSAPTCPGCGTKFSWSTAEARCIKCGLTAEVLARGKRAVERHKKRIGLKPRPGTFHRRKRAHGRPKGGSKRVRASG